jgi:hypothetical protein
VQLLELHGEVKQLYLLFETALSAVCGIPTAITIWPLERSGKPSCQGFLGEDASEGHPIVIVLSDHSIFRGVRGKSFSAPILQQAARF